MKCLSAAGCKVFPTTSTLLEREVRALSGMLNRLLLQQKINCTSVAQEESTAGYVLTSAAGFCRALRWLHGTSPHQHCSSD